MRRLVVLVLVLLAASAVMVGQQASYSFKGNTLGMSFADFKAANNKHTVYISVDNPLAWSSRPKKKFTDVVTTPLCSDAFVYVPGWSSWFYYSKTAATPKEGEILCNTSPSHDLLDWSGRIVGHERINPEGIQVMGIPANDVVYRFYQDKLQEITLFFPASKFVKIREAFVEKYGEPASTSKEEFQNGYGARWSGEVVRWNNGKQSIVMLEGSGNGPVQSSDDTTISIADLSLLPVAPKKPLDF